MMTEINTRLSEAKNIFDKSGLRLYSPEELQAKYLRLVKAIQIGMPREGSPTTADGGILAIKTGIPPVTEEQWKAVPVGKSAIGCAFAGTNWKTQAIVKTDENEGCGYRHLTKENIKIIPRSKRKMKFKEFVALMAEEITKTYSAGREQGEAEGNIGIALGFPHETVVNKYGDIDARLITEDGVLAKGWVITDWNQYKEKPLIGEALREIFEKTGQDSMMGITKVRDFSQGVLINRIVIQNDTNSVAHNYWKRPYKQIASGAVFGTGDNTSLNDVNLEIGHAVIDQPDAVFYEMKERRMISRRSLNDLESRMGGDYIKYRMLSAVGIVGQSLMGQNEIFSHCLAENIIKKLYKSRKSTIVSDIAKGSMQFSQFNQIFELSLDEVDYQILQEAASRALQQAGQLMGLILSAVTSQAGFNQGDEVSYPIEGSVFFFGHKVQDTALDTAKILLPEITICPYEAFGIIGIAQLAMVKSKINKYTV